MWSAVTNSFAAIIGWNSGACTVPNTVMRCVAASRPHAQVTVSSVVPWKSVVAAIALPAADRQHEVDAGRVGHAGEAPGSRASSPTSAPRTLVAVRLDEQLAPNMPILSALALYIAMRSRIVATGASTTDPGFR